MSINCQISMLIKSVCFLKKKTPICRSMCSSQLLVILAWHVNVCAVSGLEIIIIKVIMSLTANAE